MEAMKVLEWAVVGDIDFVLNGAALEEGPFDCLIAGDILERLVAPWRALARSVELRTTNATDIVNRPNVAYWHGWIRLIRTGRWIEPRYWTSGWHLAWRRAAAKTWLHCFLARQYMLPAVKEPSVVATAGSER